MKIFISAVVVAVILAAGGYVVLNQFQEPAEVAFKTQGVRI